MKELLTGKIGPFPGWAWILIAGGAGWLYFTRHPTTPTPTTQDQGPQAGAFSPPPKVRRHRVPCPTGPAEPAGWSVECFGRRP